MSVDTSKITVGKHLARRLVQYGVKRFFTVPGDFTLSLLDDLNTEEKLKMVGCCNELNAGYAADGHCRESGEIGCIVGKIFASLGLITSYPE
jgi:pyruvate decarboxylase